MHSVFLYFSTSIILLHIIVVLITLLKRQVGINRISLILQITLIFLFSIYLVFLWINLDRAPIRTLGETRLWYAYFLSLVGCLLYLFYQWRWIVYYSNGLSILFLTVNLLRPENFSNELLPALQSIWFIPHVIVYIFSYALFGIATLISIHFLFFDRTKSIDNWIKTDRIIEIAFAFLTLGLLFGALWAKQAWGHYWTWDPKEVWALITWCIYVLYIHYRHVYPRNYNTSAKILIIAFTLLLVNWLGIHFLPIAQQSIHTYGTN